MKRTSFLEYLNSILDEKIKQDLSYIERKRKGYKKILQKASSKYPDIVSALKSGKQLGGAPGEPISRIEAIKKVLREYKNMVDKTSNASETASQIKEKIKQLVELIKSFPNPESQDFRQRLDNLMITDDTFSNVFETVRKVLKDSGNDLYELNKLKGQIKLEVFGDYKSKQFIDMQQSLKRFKDNVEKEIEKVDRSDEEYKKKLIDVVNKYTSEYEKLKETIETIVKEYNNLKNQYKIDKASLDPKLELKSEDFEIVSNKKSAEYDGEITVKVNNNLFIDTIKTENVASKITSIFKLDSKNEVRLSEIYKPDFSKMVPKQYGGSLESLSVTELENKLILDVQTLYDTLFQARTEYVKHLDDYNLSYQRYLYHTAFLMLIATGQMVDTTSYISYRYLSEGIAVFYLEILKSMKKDINTSNTAVATYLRKYHFYTINFLLEFFKKVSELDLGTDKVVFVEKSFDNVKYCIHLFNHFKSTMDNYKRLNMNAITIYARINDFGTEPLIPSDKKKRFFQSDHYSGNSPINHQRLTVDYNNCGSIEGKKKEYLFTQTFDSEKYGNAETISAYMGMSTDLSNKKGIAVMTYGYSGTGKTYTVFGKEEESNRKPKVWGLLQATLKDIKELTKVEIRLFELYGRGVPFKNYWESSSLPLSNSNSKEYTDVKTGKTYRCPIENPSDDKVYKEIRYYNFSFDGEVTVNDPIPVGREYIPKFTNCVDIYSNTYISVADFRDRIDKFPILVEKIDKKRKESGTIRETPNNPESSRSVMIYDFKLHMENDDKPVPFIIIDLPGREEIVESFADTFLEKPLTKLLLGEDYQSLKNGNGNIVEKIKTKIIKIDSKDVKSIKLAIKALAINPYILPIIYLNKLSGDDSLRTFTTSTKNIDVTYTGVNQIYNCILRKFNESEIDGKEDMIKSMLTTVIGVTKNNENITLRQYFQNSFSNNKIEYIEGYPKFDPSMSRSTYSYDFQFFCGLCIEIMRQLVESRRYDVLDSIIKECTKYIINDDIEKNVYKLEDDELNFLLKEYFGETYNTTKSIEEKKIELIKKAQYDYISTPSEGIFINENISGLIDYLSKKLTKDSSLANSEPIPNVDREQQIKNIRFIASLNSQGNTLYKTKGEIKTIVASNAPTVITGTVRQMTQGFTEMGARKGNKERDQTEGELPENQQYVVKGRPEINDEFLEKLLDKSQGDDLLYFYNSNGLFNKENPIIENILCPYLQKIDDYKVFYLFSNFNQEFKCKYQNKLLENTEKFIKTIVPDLEEK